MKYRVLLSLALISCTAPALVLQREAQLYYHRAQETDARSLDEHEREHLALCLASVRRASDIALATHPDINSEVKAARDDVRRDCAGVEKLGRAVVPDRALPAAEPEPVPDMNTAPDMGAHDGGRDL